MSVSRAPGCSLPPRAADSSARSVVVPTATMRPPAARVRSIASTVAAGTSNHSLCMRCPDRVAASHRQEGAGAHVQRDLGAADAALLQCGEQFVVEVQGGGGRRHRAGPAREHRLIAPFVVGIVRMRDVRRQRDMTMPLEQRQRIGPEAQPEQAAVRTVAADHLDLEALATVVTEPQPTARARRLAGAHVGQCLVRGVGQQPLDQHLDRTAALLVTMKTRLDHARVVEDEQVTRVEQLRQLGEDMVDSGQAPRVEQARRAALRGRMLRDQLGRQIEIEVVELQGAERFLHAAPIVPCAFDRPCRPDHERRPGSGNSRRVPATR